MENIEAVKKQYEEEIYRLTSLSKTVQQQYQQAYTELQQQEKALMEEYQQKISDLSIGIERLRGAYTALVDLEEGKDPTLVVNGMMKPEDNNVENQESENVLEDTELTEDITDEKGTNAIDEVKEKAKEAVKKAKEKDLITPYEEFAKSELGKETAVKDVKEVVSKERLVELHKSGEYTLSEEEQKAIESITQEIQQENTKEPEVKQEDSKVSTESKVDPKDVPDYLKEQYGMKD
ncbi:hypothetical protein [uncultured Clostridium sp.]|uniref:hypothetical protein n=1 Tax=uncultured Clostridium sp. TaxID=59620 RepID=UPI0026EC9570|nr:hypothetical protein [uncultured Clostridium sp.]